MCGGGIGVWSLEKGVFVPWLGPYCTAGSRIRLSAWTEHRIFEHEKYPRAAEDTMGGKAESSR